MSLLNSSWPTRRNTGYFCSYGLRNRRYSKETVSYIPVLEILPQWSQVGLPCNFTPRLLAQPDSVGETLEIIHSLLKVGPTLRLVAISQSSLQALAFLHQNNIVHRVPQLPLLRTPHLFLVDQDLKLENTLVNHFSDDDLIDMDTERRAIGRNGRLTYALFDFDIAIIFPSDADIAACRLPYNLSWDGADSQPHDTAQGDFDYDFFACKVGCLGTLFCDEYEVRGSVALTEGQ
ncbi:unnamed protein product [Cyclocybe aegerita]|uniref:Uncharacterized protein n=1 Tax=Cyclocybe aegerita TaxID=1973307 RepID=A0A8S0W398_CYCAE|nr:unnamed protein product [Cyclocybe aegerita]